MKPYYQDQWATIYHGDCREVLPTLGKFDLLLTDPPYGLQADSKMARNEGKWGFRDYGHTNWDNECPAIVSSLPELASTSIIWGGNYFQLPPSSCWLIWNKLQRNFDFADAEMAWTNMKTAVRIFDYGRGALLQEGKVHPTQKPLPLMTWCIGFVPYAQSVIDPFMGSGTVLRAAKEMCIKSIGIELEERYCEIAARRLEQEVFNFTEPTEKLQQLTL